MIRSSAAHALLPTHRLPTSLAAYRAKKQEEEIQRPGISDKTYDEQKARVKRVIEFLRIPLQVNSYKLNLLWNRGAIVCGCGGTVMSVDSSWEYLWAHIQISIDQIEQEDDDELIESVIHEFMHIQVARMRPKDQTEDERDQEELTATLLARSHIAYAQLAVDQMMDQVRLDQKRTARAHARQVAALEAEIVALKSQIEEKAA